MHAVLGALGLYTTFSSDAEAVLFFVQNCLYITMHFVNEIVNFTKLLSISPGGILSKHRMVGEYDDLLHPISVLLYLLV